MSRWMNMRDICISEPLHNRYKFWAWFISFIFTYMYGYNALSLFECGHTTNHSRVSSSIQCKHTWHRNRSLLFTLNTEVCSLIALYFNYRCHVTSSIGKFYLLSFIRLFTHCMYLWFLTYCTKVSCMKDCVRQKNRLWTLFTNAWSCAINLY